MFLFAVASDHISCQTLATAPADKNPERCVHTNAHRVQEGRTGNIILSSIKGNTMSSLLLLKKYGGRWNLMGSSIRLQHSYKRRSRKRTHLKFPAVYCVPGEEARTLEKGLQSQRNAARHGRKHTMSTSCRSLFITTPRGGCSLIK